MMVTPVNGFTLIEVLISLTIVGVLSLMVFTSLRVGARAWEKGEREIDAIHRERTVLNLIQEQLASISTKNLVILDKKPYYLVGNQVRVAFLSSRSLIPGAEEGAVRVIYKVESDETTGLKKLLIKEERLLTPATEEEKNESDDDAFRLLIQGISQITVEYLDRKDTKDGYAWTTEWNGNQKQAFPRAVRFRLYKDALNYSTIISNVAGGEPRS